MIHNTCPCCGIDRLPHLTDCTFGSDAPEAADDFDEVLGLRDEIARLRITDEERWAVTVAMGIINEGNYGWPDGTTPPQDTLSGLLQRHS